MTYDQRILDDIRAALRVSTVVGRKFKLKKQGGEYVAIDDPSLTVNDTKGLWWDFGAHKEGGDIFDFVQTHEGRSFPEAVEDLAAQAGIKLPNANGHDQRGAPAKRADAARADGADRGGDPRTEAKGKREVVKAWDYVDPQGRPYQVVRFQKKLADGGWEKNAAGKTWKSFGQRRPSPDDDGAWVWGLNLIDPETGAPLEFMRRGDGADWSRFNEENFEAWRYTQRRKFGGQNVVNWLYGAPDVAAELVEERADQRTVFLPEGEAKVDVLTGWGLLATCNSGGAQNWTEAHAEFLRGAADVVILEDNDGAGRERTSKIAPMLLARDARVRRLSFKDVWSGCPEKGDVKDWAESGEGSRAALVDIVAKLPDWTPDPYRSRYGAVSWRDQYRTASRKYEFLVTGIVPRWQMMLWYGESQIGKSFEVLDAAMHVARGERFAGRRVTRGGVVVVAAEKGLGYVRRMNAYQKHHAISADDPLPFAVLTKPVSLFLNEKEADQLVDEVRALTATWSHPLEVLVIDTHQAATPGASIIKDEDVTKAHATYRRMMEALGCGMWIVHHKNAQGGFRGSLVLYNAIETAVELSFVTEGSAKDPQYKTDDKNRKVRRATVVKQSEGLAGITWDFVLNVVELGTDEWGDPVTSCVSVEPERAAQADHQRERKVDGTKRAGHRLNPGEVTFFKAMLAAMAEHPAPPPVGLPASITTAVRWNDFTDAYKNIEPSSEADTPDGNRRYLNTIATAIRRARKYLFNVGIIGVEELKDAGGKVTGHLVWPTGKPVNGPGLQWPDAGRAAKPSATIDEAGDPADDIKSVF